MNRSLPLNIARAIALLWLLVHFMLTIVFVGPLNPLKMTYLPFLNATIGAYFPQNWSLFAPNPLSSDQSLLVRGLTSEEVAEVPAKGLPSEGWHDISLPFWKSHQKNRFAAYDRLIRPQSNAMRQYMTGGLELAPWYDAAQKGDEQAKKIYEERLKAAQKQASVMLAKVGSAFCRDTDPSGRYPYVAVRVRQSPAVPWSERHTGEKKHQDMDLGVYPVDRQVASTGLYLAGGDR